MDLEKYLNESAAKLQQPSMKSAQEFDDYQHTFADLLNKRMAAREDVDKLIGRENLSMMQDNSRNLFRFMSSMFKEYDPKIFVNTLLWVFRAYRAHGFKIIFWSANVDTITEILSEKLPDNAKKEILPFFDWIIINIPKFVDITDEQLKEENKEIL